MNNFKKKILILFLYFFSTLSSYAENKISYIDMDFILSESNASKSLLIQLKDIETAQFEEFKIKDKKFKDDENKLLSSKNILSKEEFEKKVKDFKDKVIIFRKDKDKLVQEFNDLKNNTIQNFMKNVEPIVSDYMQKNSINIVLAKKDVIIGKKNLDITNEILKIVDKNIK